jgi:hypothetical protein
MKRTIKSVSLVIGAVAIAFILAGQAFGAQSTKSMQRVPAGRNMNKPNVGNVAGKPDLKVIALNVNPKTPSVGGGTITIKITVKNQGTAATSAPCSLTMSVFSVDENGTQIPGNSLMAHIPGYTNNIPILGPGQKHVITKYLNLHHPGRNKIEGVINTESLTPGEESNNQNNYYKHYFTMKPKAAPADLVLHDIKVTPDGRIKIRMSNAGKAIPDYAFDRAWVKATVIGSSPYRQLHLKDMDPKGVLKKPGVPSGAPGKKYVTFIWPSTGTQGIKLTPGYSYSVEVILDCFPAIIDADRSNNAKTVTLSP